jgi:hypothetical protein
MTVLKFIRFPTHSPLPRGFAFYVAGPVSSVRYFEQMRQGGDR